MLTILEHNCLEEYSSCCKLVTYNVRYSAAGHDEAHFVWGFNLQSKEGDPRLVENRVMLGSDRKPSVLEVHLVTRKADGSAREEQVATAVWTRTRVISAVPPQPRRQGDKKTTKKN